MNNIKQLLAVLIMIMFVGSFVGCGVQTKKEDKVITDAQSRKVEKPAKVNKVAITCYGGATHEIAVLGAADKIVAQPSMEKFPQLSKMYPNFTNVVDSGSFDNVNIEELLKENPDMVFVGITSKKGNKIIEEAGLPTYTMLIGTANIDKIKNEFEMTGMLLGNEQKAKELVGYWNKKLTWVQEMVANIPEQDKKKVFYTGSTITNAINGAWGDSMISHVGGINVTNGLPIGGQVSIEQVMSWEPDVIIVQKNKKGLTELENDMRIQNLAAIKNKQLYQCPIGAFWWDRPSPESPLGFMWLAKVLYPEYTKEIDLEKETKDFYSKFYNYNLTTEEYESFFK